MIKKKKGKLSFFIWDISCLLTAERLNNHGLSTTKNVSIVFHVKAASEMEQLF